MPNAEYRVNKSTGQVIKDDGTGWKPVASVRNKTTGEILIDEGSGWQPLPSQQRNLTPDPAMNMASQRANQALAGGQKIAQDDLTQLGKLDFSPAAMGKLPAPTMSEPELDAWTIERMDALERARIPDSDTKERMIAAMNGPTFGNGPRLAAGAQTVGALLATPFVEGDIIDQKGLSGAASQFLDEARVHQRRGRDERMAESMALEIVPALFQGKTIVDTLGKKFIPGTTMASNVARFSGVGGLYGALYGASQSEKGNLGGVAEDAAFGGALGAGFGLGMKALQPAATAGVRSAKTTGASLYDALAGALGKAGGARDRVAEDVAVAAVRRSMERSGLTFDEIMALVKKYEGKPAVLAEVIGQDAVNALTALTRRPGSTPQKARAIQEERVFARPERMIGDVEDATGIAVGQLDDTLAKQLEERQAAAKPIYDALYKRFNKIEAFRQPGQTGQVMKRINRLARTPLAQRHLQLAKDAVATIAGRRGIAVSKMSTMAYWDLVKRSLDDAINSAQSKGEARTRVGEGIDDLVGLKNDLVDELDRLTGGAYAAAREVGGEAPRLKAAAASGQKVMQARNPREVAKTVAATAPQDLPALRAGVVEDLGTRINKGMLPSRVRVPDIANKLRASLGEKSANKLINRLDAEASLAETGARWAPRLNSVTGTVMENGATQMGDDLINAGFNLATGNKLGLFRQAINFMRQRGFSQRQIDAIGDLLLSSPEEGLRRLKVMTPDGLPAGAAAPLAGTASGGGLPPSGGAPMGAASPAASPIRAGGFAGFPTGRFNKRPRSTPESMADHDKKLTNLFGGNPPPPRTPRDVEIERLAQVERDALAQLDDLNNRVVDMGVYPAILQERRILPSDVSPNAWPQVQEIMAQMDDAATRLMRARDEMSGLRNAPEGDAFGAPSPPNPPRTMGQGLGAGLRGDLGNMAGGALGGGLMPLPSTGDPKKDMQQRLALMGTMAVAAGGGPRLVNAFARQAPRVGKVAGQGLGGGGRKPPARPQSRGLPTYKANPSKGQGFDEWLETLYSDAMRGPDNKTVLPNVFYRGMSDAEFQAAQKAGKFQSINNPEGLYVEKDPTRYTGGGAYGAKRSGVIVQFDTTGLTPKTIRARAAGGFVEDGFDEIPNDKIARVWKWDAAKNDHVLVYEASADLPPIMGNGFGGGGRGPRKPLAAPKMDKQAKAIEDGVRKIVQKQKANSQTGMKIEKPEGRLSKGLSKLSGVMDDPVKAEAQASAMHHAGRSADEIWDATKNIVVKIDGRTLLKRGPYPTQEENIGAFWQAMALPASKRPDWVRRGTKEIFPKGPDAIAQKPFKDRAEYAAKRFSGSAADDASIVDRELLWEETGVVAVLKSKNGQPMMMAKGSAVGSKAVAMLDGKQFRSWKEAMDWLKSVAALPRNKQPKWYTDNFSEVLDAKTLRKPTNLEIAPTKARELIRKHPIASRGVALATGGTLGAAGVALVANSTDRRQPKNAMAK